MPGVLTSSCLILHLIFYPRNYVVRGKLPNPNSSVLLEDFNGHMGNVNAIWGGVIERNGLPDVNPSGV